MSTTSFLRRILPVILLTALLPACQDAKPIQRIAPPTFAQERPFSFNLAQVTVNEEYHSPGKSPNVEYLFPTSPKDGIKIWANDRLKALGGNGTLEVTIKDASVVEAELPRTKGIKGVFTKDQSQRYDGRLEVELKIYDQKRLVSEAETNVVVTRSRTIAEDASLDARERLFDQMTKEMLESMDQQFERNIPQYFGKYLVQ